MKRLFTVRTETVTSGNMTLSIDPPANEGNASLILHNLILTGLVAGAAVSSDNLEIKVGSSRYYREDGFSVTKAVTLKDWLPIATPIGEKGSQILITLTTANLTDGRMVATYEVVG